MAIQEIIELENSIGKVKRISKIIRLVCNVVAILVVFTWIALLGLSLFEFFSSNASSVIGLVYSVLSMSAISAWIVVFVRTVSSIFSEILNGEAPFGPRQVKKVKILSALMLVLFAIDTVISTGSVVLFNQLGVHVSIVSTFQPEIPFISINGGALFMAAVLYCLSIFFEYGTLLQRLSDETG